MQKQLSVNVSRFIQFVGGNVVDELYSNALEAEGKLVKVTYLDNWITFWSQQNTSEAEFDQHMLQIFNTGKDVDKNFGKGFSSVLSCDEAMVCSGNWKATFHKRSPTVEFEQTTNAEMGTFVSAKLDSEWNADKIRQRIRSFCTEKEVWFNGTPLILKTPESIGSLEKINCKGNIFIAQEGESKCFFKLVGGSFRPLDVSEKFGATIILTSIEQLDTERKWVNWFVKNAINDAISLAQYKKSLTEFEKLDYPARHALVEEPAKEFLGIFKLKKLNIPEKLEKEDFEQYLTLVKFLNLTCGLQVHVDPCGLKVQEDSSRKAWIDARKLFVSTFGISPENVRKIGKLQVGWSCYNGEIGFIADAKELASQQRFAEYYTNAFRKQLTPIPFVMLHGEIKFQWFFDKGNMQELSEQEVFDSKLHVDEDKKVEILRQMDLEINGQWIYKPAEAKIIEGMIASENVCDETMKIEKLVQVLCGFLKIEAPDVRFWMRGYSKYIAQMLVMPFGSELKWNRLVAFDYASLLAELVEPRLTESWFGKIRDFFIKLSSQQASRLVGDVVGK